MAAKAGAALVTLFDWRWPIRCHLISNSVVSAIFCRASWTLFSPKSRWPAAYAAWTWPALNVFDTARSRTSSGCRPAARAAPGVRSRMAVEFWLMSFKGPLNPYLELLNRRDDALRDVHVLARRRELQVCLEVRFGFGERLLGAGVDQRHAQPVMRVGHVGIELHRRLELRFCLGNLPGVPVNNALVEELRGAGRGRGGAGRAGCPAGGGRGDQLDRILAGFRRQVELLLRVVDVRESVIRLAEVRLDLDRLLVGGLRFVVLLGLALDGPDVRVALRAVGDGCDHFVELGDRLVGLALVAERDAVAERLRHRVGLSLGFRHIFLRAGRLAPAAGRELEV